MSKKIHWESQHLEIEPSSQKLKYGKDEEETLYVEDGEENEIAVGSVQNLTSTPFGVYSMNDDMHPMKQFKLWIGHTNFNVTNSVAEVIEKIQGVELLRVLTRYRFIVGIGKIFDTSKIKREIERIICEKNVKFDEITDKTIRNNVKNLSNMLKGNYMIIVFPNGNIDFCSSLQDQYEESLKAFKEASLETNAILIGNNE